MPSIKTGESKDQWLSRCIPELMEKEGYDNQQATAICISKWEDRMQLCEQLSLKRPKFGYLYNKK